MKLVRKRAVSIPQSRTLSRQVVVVRIAFFLLSLNESLLLLLLLLVLLLLLLVVGVLLLVMLLMVVVVVLMFLVLAVLLVVLLLLTRRTDSRRWRGHEGVRGQGRRSQRWRRGGLGAGGGRDRRRRGIIAGLESERDLVGRADHGRPVECVCVCAGSGVSKG
jgi:uncharacterized membrane protein YgcG